MLDEILGFESSLHAKTLSFNDDGVGVMQQPIQDGGGQDAVMVENLGPILKGTVRGNDASASFIAQRDDLEEQVGASLINGQIAKFVT
jgi:hypothetical protein